MKMDCVWKKVVCAALAVVLAGSPAGGQAVYAADRVPAGSGVAAVDGAAYSDASAGDGISGSDASADSGMPGGDASMGDNGNDPDVDSPGTDLPVQVYEAPVLNVSQVNLVAGGSPYQLRVDHAVSAVFTVTPGDDSAVVLTEQTGQTVTVTPVKAGEAVITAAAAGYDGQEVILTCQVKVSEVSLAKGLVEIYMNDADTGADAALQGADLDAVYYGSGDGWEESMRYDLASSSKCGIEIGNEDVAEAYFSDGAVHIDGRARGVTNLKVNIYGKELPIKVKVYHYTLNKYVINTYVGSAKKTLKVKGTGDKKVKWVTGNKKVASVSGRGVVTIKGIGTTKISAKVNGRRIICIVSVSSKTAYRVVKMARTISKRKNVKYSQAYRMSENYYDCSSLVWRCYKNYGIRFGASSRITWAPTAAEEGRWCANTKHLISNGPVEIMSCKMVPGDTIYYAFQDNNGRYLNIDHTAIFAGYGYEEEYGYYGTVLEASSSSNSVVERMYYAGDSIKLIGRPSKK